MSRCVLTSAVAGRSFQPALIFGVCGGGPACQGSSVKKAETSVLQRPRAKADGQEEGSSAARRDRRPPDGLRD